MSQNVIIAYINAIQNAVVKKEIQVKLLNHYQDEVELIGVTSNYNLPQEKY